MTPRRLPRTMDYLVMAAVLAVTALCLAYAADRVVLMMRDTPFDHAIFATAGHAFWQSGQFYPRVDTPYPTFLPGAAVFKFPPVYQLYIAPWVKDGITATYYRNSYLLCLLSYAGGMGLLCHHVLRALPSPSHCFCVCFTGIAISVACVFEPFYSGFLLLVGELPIFFCCVLALALMAKYPAWAGAAIAVAATAKLYPVFLLLYGVVLPSTDSRTSFVTGFASTAAGLWLTTVFVFGWQEPLYYLTHILPVLLQEHPMGISENLSLIFFLFPDGITHVFAENVFLLIRVITLSLLAWVTIRHYRQPDKNALDDALLYGLFITSMLLCLANYWIQYEVLLLVPALLVLGTSWQREQPVLTGMASVLVLVLLSSNELENRSLAAYAQEPLTALTAKADQHGYLPALWETSRTAFLFAVIAPLKPLVPYGLWAMSVWLLSRKPAA